MTREEAIQRLKQIKTDTESFANTYKSEENYKDAVALDMAIEALKAEETMVIQTGQTYGKSAYIKELAEVVRCKDCRWWNSETKGCKRNPSVEAWYETDFCKYGERQCNYFGERREPTE